MLLAFSLVLVGGGKRDRTADLLHAMQALSQLSYTPARKKAHYRDREVPCKAFLSISLTNRGKRLECRYWNAACSEIKNAWFRDPSDRETGALDVGGVDGTRTRDPRRDRPVF